jgi:hypothetical protein
MLLFAPDLSAALLVAAGLFLLTGLVRVVIAMGHFMALDNASLPM